MIIQHNIPAINSHRNLGINNNATAKNLEKLSSGFKINRAGDDAAGLAISEKMRGQIRGLAMAEQNTQNGVSLIQTAEGGLNETHAILQRMRELSVQASNGTYQEEDRLQITREFDNLKDEITRIAESTHYNGIKLLDGSLHMKDFGGVRTGQNTTALAKANIAGAGITAATSTVLDTGTGGTATKVGATQTIEFYIDNGELKARSTTGASNIRFNGGTLTYEAAGNDSGANKGLIEVSLTGIDKDRLYQLVESSVAGAISITVDDTNAVDTLVDFRARDYGGHNGVTGLGLAITKSGTNQKYGAMDVEIKKIGADLFSIKIGDFETTGNLTQLTGAGFTHDGLNVKVNNPSLFTANIDQYGSVGVEEIWMVDDGTGGAGAAVYNLDFGRATAQVGNQLVFQIGANGGEDQRVYMSVLNMDSNHIGMKRGETWEKTGETLTKDYMLADASIATIDLANQAIEIISAATNQVSAQRAELGAMQNRLEHTLNNLGVTKENLTAAESVIRDVDMAKEMMEFTKNNILVQAAQAMLAQATQLPQGVLQLLR